MIGLTLYGVSFSTNLKITKPIHCPFGLYEKLKALTNLTPSSRPPLDEIIDALDFESNLQFDNKYCITSKLMLLQLKQLTLVVSIT